MYMCNVKAIHVSNLSPTLQVLISNRRAQGIEFIHRGISFSVQTDKEVILTAGTYGSPAILIRSGIGPADQLQRLQVRTSLFLIYDLLSFINVLKLPFVSFHHINYKEDNRIELSLSLYFFRFVKSACDNLTIISPIPEGSDWKL